MRRDIQCTWAVVHVKCLHLPRFNRRSFLLCRRGTDENLHHERSISYNMLRDSALHWPRRDASFELKKIISHNEKSRSFVLDRSEPSFTARFLHVVTVHRLRNGETPHARPHPKMMVAPWTLSGLATICCTNLQGLPASLVYN